MTIGLVASAPALCQESRIVPHPSLLGMQGEYRLDGPPFVQLHEEDEEEIYPLPAFPNDGPHLQVVAPQAAVPKPPPDIRMLVLHKGTASGFLDGQNHLEHDITVTFTDVATNGVATLYADVLDYNGSTGDVSASGTPTAPIKFVTPDATYTGDQFEYNYLDKTGTVKNATVDGTTFKVHGELIEARADGSYIAYNAMFTTCLHGSLDGKQGMPDYRISARKMTIYPGRYVSAQRVLFYAGKQKTILLPSLKRDLRTTDTVSSVPTPSYNRHDGISLHMQGTPVSAHHTTFDYNVLANLSRLPTGYLLYQNDISRANSIALPPKGILPSLGDPLNSLLQQFSPPTYRAYIEGRPYEVYPDRITFYGIVGNQQYIFNRNVGNLTLSRLPETGIHFGNILGKLSREDSPVAKDRGVPDRIPYAPALLEAYVSLGVLHESPTGITSGRAYTRLNFASQPQIIGRRLSWRYAATNWLSAYSRGTVYDLLAPEVEMDYTPTRTSVLNVGYRYLTDAGSTPFTSDRRDIRHEVRLQYQVGGPYVFGITAKFDLEELRAYDEEIALVRHLDCMQYGIAYRVRSQQFQVIFNLLPVSGKQTKEKQ